jgi:hypothetical protein
MDAATTVDPRVLFSFSLCKLPNSFNAFVSSLLRGKPDIWDAPTPYRGKKTEKLIDRLFPTHP